MEQGKNTDATKIYIRDFYGGRVSKSQILTQTHQTIATLNYLASLGNTEVV